MARMHVFNDSEKELFENPPTLNRAEQKQFFAQPTGLDQFVEKNLRTPTNVVCFLLMLGYFRATKRFFPNQFHEKDVRFIVERLQLSGEQVDIAFYNRGTFIRHKKVILDHFGFREFSDKMKNALHKETASLLQSELKPKHIMMELFKFLIRRKTEIPSYNLLSAIIIEETHRHKQRLTRIVGKHLSEKQREILEALLEKENSDSNPVYQRYRLTMYKRVNQSLRPSKIRANAEDLKVLREMFVSVENIVNALALTHEGIMYYAQSVIKAKVFQIARRIDKDKYLHLVSFITHQYFSMQDALIDTHLLAVQSVLNSAWREHKDQYYAARGLNNDAMKDIICYLDQNTQTFSAIKTYASAPDMSDREKLTHITAILEKEELETKRREARLERLRQGAEAISQEQDIYSILEAKSLKLQNRCSEIIKSIEFNVATSVDQIIAAIAYFREKDGAIDRNAPIEFLKPAEQAAIFDEKGKLRVSLYKMLLFIKVAEAIKAGTLNLRDSYKYRSLDDYLIDTEEWQSNRKDFIRRADLQEFANPAKTLKKLSILLDECFQYSNRNIIEEQNKLIKFNKKGFHLNTPKVESNSSETLAEIFPSKHYISLSEVLGTINRSTCFLNAFDHWQSSHNRVVKPHERTFVAGIIGYGCNIGPRKIARISKHIKESDVENTINWYFTVENVTKASDAIIQFTDQLDLPNVYRKEADVLHTSSDGQKYEVAVDSLNANYSYKYFGKDRGVSNYSFIDERHMLFYSTVISASEREAAYVIDGLMHNDVIKSDIHSTDTHGYSEIIFAVSYLLGFTFAPRIKNLSGQRIYSFIKKKVYAKQAFKIMPDGYINPRLIEDNWNEILRFIATIKLRVSTASQLFRRLNSYAKQHPLYRALKEFGKIIKSIFILQYIDDPEFRQRIEKQLNKIESSNKFAKVISFGNNQEFMQGTKEEQDLAEGCSRLIENAIVCWNYLFLSQKIVDEKDRNRRAELIEIVKNGSVVTWKHINLHGEYDFSEEKLSDSMGLNVAKLLKLKL